MDLRPPCYNYALNCHSFCLFGNTKDTYVMYEKATFVCFIYMQPQKLEFKYVQINMKHVLYVVCHDSSHHLLKYLFGICLCSMLISLSNVLNLLKKANFLFSASFGGHFCYHSNCNSRMNSRLLHFGYCSNKIIRTNW